MKRLVGFCAAALLIPVAAGAQVYPERIITIKTKARSTLLVSNYQGRDRRDGNREEQVDRTTRTFKLGANGVLALNNIAGDIAITRATGAETTVEIVKTARGRDVNDAREMLQLVTVDVNERAGRADIRTRYPNGDEARRSNRRNVNVSVAYNVTAPEGTRITAESISGSVKVTDIKGDVTANTISGNIRISGAGRVNAAKTISGTVEITDTKMDGALESSSVSGDVIVRRVSARRISASSVSGNVKFDDLQCERVSGNTTSGSVNFVGALARTGRYELGSFSGEVHLFLSGGVGFEVEANSFSGSISSDFDIVTRGQPGNRRGRQTSLVGTFGDGSAVLDLTTFSGTIVISKR
jgi:hypothetical protein